MRLFLALLFTLVSLSTIAGEIVLQGVYRGKDIYIKNPFDPESGKFCTQKVFVNDQLIVSDPRASAFRVDLSYLRQGSIVVIRVEHMDNCEPQIINPQVLQQERGFRFISTQVTNNSIDWTTDGESDVGKFIVEQEVFDLDSSRIWVVWKEIESKGGFDANSYAVAANNFPGENIYRIKYEPIEAESTYSVNIYYTSTKNPITFSPISVTTRIVMSETTYYEITDRNGKLLKSGTSKTIQLLDLKPGEYYLHIQNRVERFVKK